MTIYLELQYNIYTIPSTSILSVDIFFILSSFGNSGIWQVTVYLRSVIICAAPAIISHEQTE